VRNYLIVANQTLGGDALAAKVRRVLDDHGPCRFHIVVPATRVPDALTWTSGTARALARGRLERAIARFESMGLEVTGEVADESPVLAILDALHKRNYNGIILCTLPPGASRWLKQDLPRRLGRRVPVAVTHLVASRELELAAA